MKEKKIWSLISNQPNVKWWNGKKNQLKDKRKPESIHANLLNPWSESWDRGKFIKKK
jgi:hypothetical protein